MFQNKIACAVPEHKLDVSVSVTAVKLQISEANYTDKFMLIFLSVC